MDSYSIQDSSWQAGCAQSEEDSCSSFLAGSGREESGELNRISSQPSQLYTEPLKSQNEELAAKFSQSCDARVLPSRLNHSHDGTRRVGEGLDSARSLKGERLKESREPSPRRLDKSESFDSKKFHLKPKLNVGKMKSAVDLWNDGALRIKVPSTKGEIRSLTKDMVDKVDKWREKEMTDDEDPHKKHKKDKENKENKDSKNNNKDKENKDNKDKDNKDNKENKDKESNLFKSKSGDVIVKTRLRTRSTPVSSPFIQSNPSANPTSFLEAKVDWNDDQKPTEELNDDVKKEGCATPEGHQTPEGLGSHSLQRSKSKASSRKERKKQDEFVKLPILNVIPSEQISGSQCLTVSRKVSSKPFSLLKVVVQVFSVDDRCIQSQVRWLEAHQNNINIYLLAIPSEKHRILVEVEGKGKVSLNWNKLDKNKSQQLKEKGKVLVNISETLPFNERQKVVLLINKGNYKIVTNGKVRVIYSLKRDLEDEFAVYADTTEAPVTSLGFQEEAGILSLFFEPTQEEGVESTGEVSLLVFFLFLFFFSLFLPFASPSLSFFLFSLFPFPFLFSQ
eukprot:TRINITY_DN5015_c0_g1_i1.p1 TRINITY_DN5015_c0_g1~~TRINITY_DN5015_c0_g1_i1.p1  ORF type:complete len:563 (+),score=93.35 TRINITY_DN5015_c0_g1_i1:54-1742(+)